MFSLLRRRTYPRYATTIKRVGETPLIATERLRYELRIPTDIPLAYAGRLDPMASGKLLVLIGEECKKQTQYHGLDKAYSVELLLGVQSDSGDVLGLVSSCVKNIVTPQDAQRTLGSFVGDIELPYPHFSSKTVKGKPLHVWTLEKRLDEITIPTKRSRVYALVFNELRIISKEELLERVKHKIESVRKVTDPRKVLGADFRRELVRQSWRTLAEEPAEVYQVLSFTCIASSGTYMRSLGERIAAELGSCGLAYSIHRTTIGEYMPLGKKHGVWITKF